MNIIKTQLLLLAFFPLLLLSQNKSSVEIYYGNGSFEGRIVDLSNRNLSKLPAFNSQVEVLILDNNNITELPEWLMTLPNLRSLSIRNNNLNDVDILGFCEKLEELYLSNNPNLFDLPSFSRCKKLQIIDVTDTKINDLPINIRGMENIAYFKYSKIK